MLGRFLTEQSYAPIRDALPPTDVTAQDLSIDAKSLTPRKIARAGSILDWHGIVALRDFLPIALVDQARQEADAVVAQLETAIAVPEDHGETDGILWQIGSSRFRDHRAIEAQHRPLANLRSRERGTINGGIIDLFFVEMLAQEQDRKAMAECCECLTTGTVPAIIAAVSRARPAHVNLLRNDSITATRGLHVDNLWGSYKAFLYLTDVSTDEGPYAYTPGSHRRPDLLRREARLNALCGRAETDCHAFEGREIAFPVRKGTVVISCQSGVHRGLPQKPGASRTVLVGNYRP